MAPAGMVRSSDCTELMDRSRGRCCGMEPGSSILLGAVLERTTVSILEGVAGCQACHSIEPTVTVAGKLTGLAPAEIDWQQMCWLVV